MSLNVIIRETYEKKVPIDTANKQEALAHCERLYDLEQIVLDSSSFTDIEFVCYAPGEELAARLEQFLYSKVLVKELLKEHIRSCVVRIEDRIISVQSCDDGCDYSIYNAADMFLLDGGVYDEPGIFVYDCLGIIVKELASHTGYSDVVCGAVCDDSAVSLLTSEEYQRFLRMLN